MRGSSRIGLHKLILVDRHNWQGGVMMMLGNFTYNENYWQMVITMKIHGSCFLRAGIDLHTLTDQGHHTYSAIVRCVDRARRRKVT